MENLLIEAASARARYARGRVWPGVAVAVAAILLVVGVIGARWSGMAGPATAAGPQQPAAPPAAVLRAATAAEFAERNGIEVLMLGITAEGGLIDMRFRVTDAEKAAFLLEEANRPRLVVEDSGTVLTRHIRPEYKALEVGRVYDLLYANAQNAIRSGSLVTVELAGLSLEHLTAR